MKLYMLLIIGFVLGMTGCENKRQVTEPIETKDPVVEKMTYQYEGIVKHMHAHADQLDLINIALDDGDLDASKLPARWLWRHDTMSGVPTDWQSYLSGMRDAARAVENSADLETARAASKRINEQCQACHTAAGINNKNEVLTN